MNFYLVIFSINNVSRKKDINVNENKPRKIYCQWKEDKSFQVFKQSLNR